MNTEIKAQIEEKYGIQIAEIEQAPRQFVAETWFVTTTQNERYFVKIVDKPLFIPEIIESLPVLNALQEAGINKINWPLKTVSNDLFIKKGETLIVLFNAIDAPQTYEYSEAALGELLAEVHSVTTEVKTKTQIPTENYEFVYKERFEQGFEGILSGKLVTDNVTADLQELLKGLEERIRMQYVRLDELTAKMKRLDLPKVITHGDAGGNTLVKSYDDVYIIDWDGILLAPPERDAWIPGPEFLIGYGRVVPQYEPNDTSLSFYTVMYYFRSFAQYLAEVISEKPDTHRIKNVNDMRDSFFDGWMVSYLKRAKAY